MEKNQRTDSRDPSYSEAIRQTGVDLIKIVATGAALAFIGVTGDCSKLVEKVGINTANFPDWQTGLCALAVGAGAFSGYTDRHRAALLAYAGTLAPEVYELFQGDPAQAARVALAKTIAFGGAYALGKIFS